jgi:hypothetical protein
MHGTHNFKFKENYNFPAEVF